ncbi:hypothetical protein [Methylorubrum sp. SB2]|uniref:hypothetical protein n=1 Tax=Methylorubrum subtropicum TaxID=3138812 RepID=UPI00313ADD38
MTVDREKLREEMARLGFNGWYGRDEYDDWPVQGMWERTADAQLAGPLLSALLAQADTAERMEAVLQKYESRFRTDALRPELQTLEERVVFACNEAIAGREGERRLAERAGITLDVTAADDPAALLDALRAAAVERACLSAEVEALRAERDAALSHLPEGLRGASLAGGVQALAFSASADNDSKWRWGHALTIGLAFADKAAGEEWEHGGMASVDVCLAMAATLACDCDSDEWAEMAKSGAARLAEYKAEALPRTTDQPDPGAREGASLPVEAAAQEGQTR